MKDINEYQKFASEALRPESDGKNPLVHFSLGMAGECGEICNDVKKRVYHGRVDEVSLDDIGDECGDVLWYLANVATSIGWTLEDVIDHNIDKLKKRYEKLYK